MKAKLIIPTLFLVVFLLSIVFGSGVGNWWSFLTGAIFALSVRDIGGELMRRASRR